MALLKNAIEISNLSKSYKTKSGYIEALKNISLAIPKGSFFGLLGPNGAGKSTLINIIADLVKKDSGTIVINGYDYDKNKNHAKKSLGIVPQELVIDPFFKVKEALDIYAGYYGIKKHQRKTTELINALGLSDKITATPRSLSGGMRRRLLVAKALVHDPDIIILDEPTAGVDVELRDQLWQYISKLNQAGKTIILTTHYLEEAEKLCDQIAIINHGKIITNEKKENLKKIFGVKTLIIEYKNISPNESANLAKFGTVKQEDNKIFITYKSGDFNYKSLINSLSKSKSEIINFSTEETDIEDIFKNLVYK
ncbi:MAG: ABC transporter ATP-binding protein [Rickettsiales bacterium]